MSGTAALLFIVGLGIGAYGAESIRPCVADTLTVTKQRISECADYVSAKVGGQRRRV
eukprot:CAMPEP_0203900042 /NCGR_PEP_ID=MMETSP0359-20131031/42366_1 /ASSEMBLY_ACC=CAM_ASM_000338 /TAXON_ID=268821 /ORGANISM="Scrippsiella Hangoei, Strain SHTV-5" /LENGTH=56 /DNA_ID=CAMNT_0050823407 /DNA_START=1 /DNA_END=171 /DNA_ORIENTATION=+